MLKIISQTLHKTASLPENIRLELDDTEDRIFSFIREASLSLPSQPAARVAGGWVRDKLLNRPSKDIDITIEGMMSGKEFGDYLKQYAMTQYGQDQKIIGNVKGTEARPEQIKNLDVAFLRIYGQDIEIVDPRAVEFYKPGDRNPTVIRFRELKQISETGGIVEFIKQHAPHLLPAIVKLPPQDRNNPFEAIKVLDAHRRDLTMNSLFYNINISRVEDFTGEGYDDLATMTLRTPIDPIKTFQDDPLRLLRVLRFHSRYSNSQIAPEILEAMQDEDVQFQITRRLTDPQETGGIVPERTAEELRKLMKGSQPEAAIRVMYETGLLHKILNLPESFYPLEMDQQNKHHELSVIMHTMQVLRNVNNLSQEYGIDDDQRMLMNFSSLFHDLGKLDPRSHSPKEDGSRGYMGDPSNPNAMSHQDSSGEVWANFAKSLRLSNDEATTIRELVVDHMNPHSHIEGMENAVNDRTLRRYIRKNPMWVMQYIHAMADAMSKSEDESRAPTQPYQENLDRLHSLAPSAHETSQPKMNDLLSGGDIIQIVGLPAKPPPGLPGYIEVVKERIRDMQDDSPNFTKDQAIQFVQQMVANGEFQAYTV